MIDVFKVLGDENRTRIINLLMKKSLCVCEIETLLAMKQSNVSRHLNKLKQAKVISSLKEGQWVYYKMSEDFMVLYPGLVDDFKKHFGQEGIYKEDLEIMDKYQGLHFTCETIKAKAEDVALQIGRRYDT